MLDSVTEALDKIEVKRQHERALLKPETDLDALGYLKRIYQDSRQPTHIRMKAAIEALPFEKPKLAVIATVQGQDVASLLEARLRRIEDAKTKGLAIEGAPTNGDRA
jgi:hypothetical protein